MLFTGPIVEASVIPEHWHGGAAISLCVNVHVYDSDLGKLRIEAEPVLHGTIRNIAIVADSDAVMVEHVELYSNSRDCTEAGRFVS